MGYLYTGIRHQRRLKYRKFGLDGKVAVKSGDTHRTCAVIYRSDLRSHPAVNQSFREIVADRVTVIPPHRLVAAPCLLPSGG